MALKQKPDAATSSFCKIENVHLMPRASVSSSVKGSLMNSSWLLPTSKLRDATLISLLSFCLEIICQKFFFKKKPILYNMVIIQIIIIYFILQL